MPGVTKCYTPFQAQVLRATRLDGCGNPVAGAKGQLVSDGLMSIELKGQWDSGTEVEVKNAKGQIKMSAPGCQTLKYYDVTVTLTGVDPDLFEIFTGQQLITNGRGDVIGIAEDEYVPCNRGTGLETWTLAGNEDGNCDAATLGQLYGYFLTPYLVNGSIGDITLNDGAMNCVLNARTKRGSKWGVGPYLVADSATTGTTVTPAKLQTAVGPRQHKIMFTTPVPPPTAVCGAQVLTLV